MEDDERLAGQGLAAAFAAAFPSLPDDSEIPSLATSTSWARVAGLLGVDSLSILDVVQANAKDTPAAEKVRLLKELVAATLGLVIGANGNVRGKKVTSLARWPPNPRRCWALTWRTIGPMEDC